MLCRAYLPSVTKPTMMVPNGHRSEKAPIAGTQPTRVARPVGWVPTASRRSGIGAPRTIGSGGHGRPAVGRGANTASIPRLMAS
jgi:hypothetical protein